MGATQRLVNIISSILNAFYTAQWSPEWGQGAAAIHPGCPGEASALASGEAGGLAAGRWPLFPGLAGLAGVCGGLRPRRDGSHDPMMGPFDSRKYPRQLTPAGASPASRTLPLSSIRPVSAETARRIQSIPINSNQFPSIHKENINTKRFAVSKKQKRKKKRWKPRGK